MFDENFEEQTGIIQLGGSWSIFQEKKFLKPWVKKKKS